MRQAKTRHSQVRVSLWVLFIYFGVWWWDPKDQRGVTKTNREHFCGFLYRIKYQDHKQCKPNKLQLFGHSIGLTDYREY